MFNTLKSWLGLGEGKKEQISSEAQNVLDHARETAEKDLGRTLPHQLILKTRSEMSGLFGRCHSSATSLIELSKELLKNPVELFITYYHELLHAAGIMSEGAVEWLSQEAAKLNGYAPKASAYPRQTRAFEELANVMTPIADARTRFSHMLKVAQEHDFGLQGAVQGLQRKGLAPQKARSKANELIAAIQ